MATINVPVINSTTPGSTIPAANSLVLSDGSGNIAVTAVNCSALISSGTIQGNVVSLTASATAGAATDYLCNATSAAIVLTMALASLYPGAVLNVIKTDSGANTVTISGASGVSSIMSQWGRIRIVSNGTTWIATN